MNGCYVADLFSGAGGVARAIRRTGFAAREFDVANGPEGDLTKRSVWRGIVSDVRRGFVLGAMLAPPCASFSPARDRTGALRSRDFPMGLPNLSEPDRLRVESGNACLEAAAKLLNVFHSAGLPWILENPHASKMWWHPRLEQLHSDSLVTVVVADFCQFNRPWRKRTRFLCGNINPDYLCRLAKRCEGKGGLCSATGLRHFVLKGNSPQGVAWTRIAQPYPGQLSYALAYALTAAARATFYKV